MGWREFRLGVAGEVLLLVGALAGTVYGQCVGHEAQYAGAAVMVAELSPRPPRRGRCARATVVAGRLAAWRRLVRHLSGGGWWQHAEQVVAPSAGAVPRPSMGVLCASFLLMAPSDVLCAKQCRL